MAIPKKYLHQSGRHKGKLKQDLLQCEGNFVYRDPHPKTKEILFRAYSYKKKKQEWGKIDTFPKLKPPTPPTGIPKELLKNGMLNGELLQIKGTFSKGDSHPLYNSVVFHGIRENGKQRWQTQEQYNKNLKYSAKYQADWRKENPEESQKRGKANYKKMWGDPDRKKILLNQKNEKYANRTDEQIKKDYERGVKYREKNADRIKVQKRIYHQKNKVTYMKMILNT